MGLPLVLLFWSAFRKESSILRLLTIYWKIASLFPISLLLLTDQKSIGFITNFLAPMFMVGAIWFWVDINEELADLPPWRPLPFTVRVWRWALSGFGIISCAISFISLKCINSIAENNCLAWLEGPKGLHEVLEVILKFLLGAQWTEQVAAFVGYLALMTYIIGLLQWLLIRLPRQGRIAGQF